MQIVVHDLIVERGQRRVIDGLSMTVTGAEALVLAGANGAGKTTLLRTLAGFLRPTAGTVQLEGGAPERTLAEQAHVVGHANAIKANLTVMENLAFWAGYLAPDAGGGDRVAAALAHFNLTELKDFPAGYLSAGQKRRVGLARLLAAPRPIWLLDEPTAALDTRSSALVADAINAHTAAGGLVIAATHLPLGLERTREVRLAGGRVAA